MPTLSPRVKAAFIVATTAVLYVAAAQFRVSVAVTNGTLALVSPPTGITLSVVLLWGPIALPGVVIGIILPVAFTRVVYADDGTVQTDVDDAMIDRVAAAWAGHPATEAKKESIEEDQNPEAEA